MDSLRGQLLIASPKLHDPNFRRTVVLLAEHGAGGALGLVGDHADLEDVAAAARRARVFAGYAGWSAEQLEREIDSLDWIVEPAAPDDVFAPPSVDLWASVLRRKGREFRLIATMPPDPQLN